MRRLRVGLIGTGRIGRLHARNLAQRLPEAELVAVADVNHAAAEACAAELGVAKVYDRPEPFFQDEELEAVVIASSTDTHAELIEAAASAGKHVFCEKPIDLDLGRTDRALAAVARAGVQLQLGFNRRFDPHFARLREAVAAGEIGEVHLVHITSRDPAPPPIEYVRVSGGLFLDMTIHDFDMARFLVGSEVVEVFAQGRVRVAPQIGEAGDVDTAIVLLTFANGTLGAIDNSRRAVYGYDQRLEVFGSGGVLIAENPLPYRLLRGDGAGFHRPALLPFFVERYDAAYLEEMRAFVRSVLEGKPVSVNGADGRAAIVLGLAATRSLKEGRPVRVDEIG